MISGKTALRWLSHFDLWSTIDCHAVDRNDTFLTEKSVARHDFNFAYMENFVRSQTSSNSVTQYDCVVLLISLWSGQPNCLHQFLYSNKIFFLSAPLEEVNTACILLDSLLFISQQTVANEGNLLLTVRL